MAFAIELNGDIRHYCFFFCFTMLWLLLRIKMYIYTGDTGVLGVQVCDEVGGTGDGAQQGVLGHGHVALRTSGALLIHLRDDIGDASDVVIAREAASEVHTTVLGVLHQNDGAFRARRVEILQLTVLLSTHCTATTTDVLST